ncbi:MAG: hypothetical protein WCF83_05015 [Pseudolabrys sp.]
MEVEERLEMSRVLLDELERLTGQLTPNNKELPEIIAKSLQLKVKMSLFYIRYQPQELIDQMELLDSVIKQLKELNNKRGYQ